MRSAALNIDEELSRFVDNTLAYAQQEKALILGRICFRAEGFTSGQARRGSRAGLGYNEDLEILSSYIQEAKPILIGVDGGADALLKFGHKPHVIVGDMDSVSDEALKCGAELVAHAYVDGRCPGQERLEQLQLDYHVVPAPGMSEDLALLMAHDQGAELIVLVGSHSNMIDFLEKGRKGMASTFLTRMKIGPILLDAKGVSKLYNTGSAAQLVPMVFAVAILFSFSSRLLPLAAFSAPLVASAEGADRRAVIAS